MSEAPWFTRARKVEAADIDMQGHMNNVRFVQWVQDIAVAHSHDVGLDQEAYLARNLVWVVREHHVTYFGEALLDDELGVATRVVEATAVTMVRATRITRGETLLVEGRTLWCMIDAVKKRPCRVPADIRARFLPA